MAYDPRKWFSYSNLYDEKTTEQSSRFASGPTESQHSVSYPVVKSEPEAYDAKEIEVEYVDENFQVKQESDGYDPCAPSVSSTPTKKNELDPRKLDRYIATLQKLIRPLSPDHKRKLPYDVIVQLAHAVLDGTVFEIAKGLQDIQALTEKNMFEKRSKLINEQRAAKNEMKRRHQKDISDAQSRPHQVVVLEKQQSEEKKAFRQKAEKELTQLDQKLMLDIDQQVSDQQVTLQRAGLPFFFITNNPEDIKLQMIVIEFIMKLADS